MEVTWVCPPLVWSLQQQSDLYAVVEARLPLVAQALGELEAGFVAQTLPVAGSWGPFHRPFGHWRALYRVQPERGCLAFKGTESYTEELEVHYNALLDRYAVFDFSIHRPGFSHPPTSATLSVLDRFLYVEGKFPGTVLLTEALSEVRASAGFQLAHYRRYGCLACVPLPLAVYRVPDQVVERVVQAVCSVVDEASHACVQQLASQGFAVLVYWVPHLPLRVAHLGLKADLSPDERLHQLSAMIAKEAEAASPEMVVENWVSLVARMLALGYSPVDPRSAIRGSCVDSPNLTLDGGIVDLDSLRPFDSFRNQAEVHNAIEQSIETLQHSVSLYLVGDRHQGGDCGPLRQELVQRLRQESETLPPALREYVQAESCYQRILLKQRTDWRLAGNLEA